MYAKRLWYAMALSVALGASVVYAWSPKEVQEASKAMLKDAEEMIMHGGMGDGSAIVHHCGEVTKHAEAILKQLPSGNDEAKAVAPHLQDAIKHCRRVAELGDKVDPGMSLNPAVKARAAVKEAVKRLQAIRDNGA